MSSFVVEKGIPVPHAARGSSSKYPFATMEVGDSFLVDVPDHRTMAVACSMLYSAAKSAKVLITLRTDKNNRAIRVWRAAAGE